MSPSSVVAIAPAYNEAGKIRRVARRVREAPRVAGSATSLIVIDDGSTDDSADQARAEGAEVISLGRVVGVGAAIRRGFEEAIARGAEIAVVMAGNDKDDPTEIPLLTGPILAGEADLVQGSRWLGGDGARNTPAYRRWATRLHPVLLNLAIGTAATGFHFTDTTNGFRAIHRRVLERLLPYLRAPSLDGYELEPFLLLAAVRDGFRVREAAVTKTYPPKTESHTKMRPLLDWWNILRPVRWGVLRRAGIPAGPPMPLSSNR